ncbi:sphingomyelin phosphodiesterase 3 [Elysia marginata]|uniref:sphingomyelin phosphodiesterase n=1 Tax=Elysia marginata TaxID=1093978 RepID=A0AAV4JNT1_9GAST|nr:sphingomyelin phosphodiesterase 3 [Elysia marginata]
MATLREPLASQAANLCLALVRYLLYPSYVSFNCLASLYYPTFEEQEEGGSSNILLKQVLLTLPFAALFILLLPVTAVLLPLRCLLLTVRRPFRYSELHNERTRLLEETARRAIAAGQYKFGVGSANICLMPELLSRMNHLSDVDYRSVSIGQRIKEDQFASHQMVLPCNGSTSGLPSSANGCGKSEQDVGSVSSSFPPLDVLCIQEAWSSYHNKVLIEELHQTFPYIVHDVGIHALNVNSFVLNSGHLVASRHPIEAVEFKPYKHFVDHGKIISMGVTSVKV